MDVSAVGTTHGSANPDDQRVPLILFGHGVRPGRYEIDASPADIAPTLASLVGHLAATGRGDGPSRRRCFPREEHRRPPRLRP